MIVVNPITITPDILTSNVTITETIWTAGTYSNPDQRYEGTTLYEAVGTTTDQPSVGAAKTVPTWIVVGEINRFRMFDFAIGQKTTRASPIEVEIDSGLNINGVAFVEIEDTSSVQVIVTDPIDGVVYDETQELVDLSAIFDFYTYCFADVQIKTDAIFLNLPNYPGAVVKAIITGPGTVSVGETVFGPMADLGTTLIYPNVGRELFSSRERDQFGTLRLVKRRSARLLTVETFIEQSRVVAVDRTLERLDARVAFYIAAEDRAETYVLGVYRNYNIEGASLETSTLRIELEGII